MCPKNKSNSARIQLLNQQKGSALVMGIFILIVLMLLAMALVRLLSSGAQGLAYEVLGTRAYSAANAGAQQQLQLLFPLDLPARHCSEISANPYPDLSTIDGFQQCQIVNLQCQNQTVDATKYYSITATAECSAGEVSTSRTIQVDARSL